MLAPVIAEIIRIEKYLLHGQVRELRGPFFDFINVLGAVRELDSPSFLAAIFIFVGDIEDQSFLARDLIFNDIVNLQALFLGAFIEQFSQLGNIQGLFELSAIGRAADKVDVQVARQPAHTYRDADNR